MKTFSDIKRKLVEGNSLTMTDAELTEEYAKYCKTTDDPMEYDDWFIGTDYLHKE